MVVNVDEALAHVEDATPGEDVEAWIAKLLAVEVRELRARTDAVRAELEKAKRLTRESGIPVAALVGLQLAVLCLDGEPNATEGEP